MAASILSTSLEIKLNQADTCLLRSSSTELQLLRSILGLYSTNLTEQEEIPMWCKTSFFTFNRTGQGGFQNPSKIVHFKKAFTNSLRDYARPQTSYIKKGGQSTGFTLTKMNFTTDKAGVSPLKKEHIDYMIASQLHLGSRQQASRNSVANYQRSLDSRLSQPRVEKTRGKVDPKSQIRYSNLYARTIA